jgi:hypothetical protein
MAGKARSKLFGKDFDNFHERTSDEDSGSILDHMSQGGAGMTPERRIKHEHSDRSDHRGSFSQEFASVESEQEVGESCSADIETMLERNRCPIPHATAHLAPPFSAMCAVDG